ncbi:MAG: integrase core domain-containing protein, partial [bacterium]
PIPTPPGSPSKPGPRARAGGPSQASPVPGPHRDAKYSGAFDEVFRTEGVTVIRTPIRAPWANAFAERWVRTVRTECLDWILVRGRRHLERVLHAYAEHYNAGRPHRGLDLAAPEDKETLSFRSVADLHLHRTDKLGGLIHEYEVAA